MGWYCWEFERRIHSHHNHLALCFDENKKWTIVTFKIKHLTHFKNIFFYLNIFQYSGAIAAGYQKSLEEGEIYRFNISLKKRDFSTIFHLSWKQVVSSPSWSPSDANAGGNPDKPDPPPPDDALFVEPGAGGLFNISLIFLQFSSSLSSFGSCIQKKNFRLDDLNFSTYTLPVVHWATLLNSISSGKMIRSLNKQSDKGLSKAQKY